MREDPNPEKPDHEKTFAGDNFVRKSGDYAAWQEVQLHALTAYDKGADLNTMVSDCAQMCVDFVFVFVFGSGPDVVAFGVIGGMCWGQQVAFWWTSGPQNQGFRWSILLNQSYNAVLVLFANVCTGMLVCD